MSTNIIQIKRSETTATPALLANGELAWSSNSDVLFIGDFGNVVPIAGLRNPGTLTANQALVANSTSGIDKIIVANAVVTSITANGTLGTAGQVLKSNGTVSYWDTLAPSTFTLAADSGTPDTFSTGGTLTFTGGNGVNTAVTDDTVTITVLGGDGLVSNTLGVHVGQGNGISVAADSIRVQQANGIAVDAGGVRVTGGPTLTVNATGVHVNSSLSITDLTLSGNLTVSGTLTTIDTTNLVVQDPLIKLANGNVSTDALDIGFFGVYDTSGAQDLFAGMFRDATDNVFKLFTGSQVEPTTTVDTTATGYTQGTLQAFLDSGGLVSNSSAVTLTANSTLAVNLTANTLTLTTPLGVASGGTGKASVTSQALLLGNGTGALAELTLGTAGQVLQSNGTALVYANLDGGTF